MITIMPREKKSKLIRRGKGLNNASHRYKSTVGIEQSVQRQVSGQRTVTESYVQ